MLAFLLACNTIPSMPTTKEINYVMQLVGENEAVALTNVFNLLRGIAKQGIWQKRDGTLVYTDDLDLETIDQAVLDIFTGDYAMRCLSRQNGGVNPTRAALFNQYVVHTLTIILKKLAALRPTNPRKCAALLKLIKEEFVVYLMQL